MKPYIGIYTAQNETQATLVAVFCTEHAQFTQAMAGWEYVDLAAHLKAMIDNQDDQTHHVREFDSLDQVMEMIDTSDDEITVIETESLTIVTHLIKQLANAEQPFTMDAEGGIYIFDIPNSQKDAVKASICTDLVEEDDYTIYTRTA